MANPKHGRSQLQLMLDTALTVEEIAIGTRVPFSKLLRYPFAVNNAALDAHREVDALIYTLRTYLLRTVHQNQHTEFYEIPANGWEHFKQDYAPAWFKKRFPVTMVKKSVTFEKYTNVCPHADFAWDRHSTIHLEFMQGLNTDHYPAPEEYLDAEWIGSLRQAVNRISPKYEEMDLRSAVIRALGEVTGWRPNNSGDPYFERITP